MLASCLGWCASVEMVNFAPLALAVRISVPCRSRRSGLALISNQTPRRAASATTRSKAKGKGSRCSGMRPVGCPTMRRCGHSSARNRRSVISADSWFMWLCTLPITRSSSASASSARSMVPSLRMSHSMPLNTRIPRPAPSIWRTRRANSTTRFSSRPLVMESALEWSVMAIYVALDAAEHAYTQAGAIHLAHAAGEFHHAFLIQPVGHGKRLGVVRDGDVLVAECARRLGHFLQAGATIGFGGVHVQVALDVAGLHQFGQESL